MSLGSRAFIFKPIFTYQTAKTTFFITEPPLNHSVQGKFLYDEVFINCNGRDCHVASLLAMTTGGYESVKGIEKGNLDCSSISFIILSNLNGEICVFNRLNGKCQLNKNNSLILRRMM